MDQVLIKHFKFARNLCHKWDTFICDVWSFEGALVDGQRDFGHYERAIANFESAIGS